MLLPFAFRTQQGREVKGFALVASGSVPVWGGDVAERGSVERLVDQDWLCKEPRCRLIVPSRHP